MTGFRTPSLRAAAIAFVLGMAPLAASTAASPADNGIPIDTNPAAVEAGCRNPTASRSCQPNRVEAQPSTTPLGRGTASYYGRKFHGRRTASGEPFDMGALTAAHRSLPFWQPCAGHQPRQWPQRHRPHQMTAAPSPVAA